MHIKSDQTSYSKDAFPDWTIEEFDSIQENHHFSRHYKSVRNRMIRQYRRKRTGKWSLPAVAAAVAACMLFPVGVYAFATHADFFRNAFGDAGRKSVAAHTELTDNGNGEGGKIEITYPERDYVAIDPDQADKLIGEQTSSEPVTADINDHRLTILSAVRDKNAMAMEFTLECSTGVTVYDFDSLSNEAKGARSADNATIRLMVKGGEDGAFAGEFVYIDQEKSTDTLLHCYDYCVFGEPLEDGKEPVLDIYYADVPLLSLTEDESPQEMQISIPAANTVAATVFSTDAGGYLELSPLSCSIDLGKGLGLSQEEAYDPGNLKKVSVHYKDGSVYEVCDNDAHIDNTSYMLGGVGKNHTITTINLNRLVETDQVDYVMVNDVRYTAK
jgi:hypothetical protein